MKFSPRAPGLKLLNPNTVLAITPVHGFDMVWREVISVAVSLRTALTTKLLTASQWAAVMGSNRDNPPAPVTATKDRDSTGRRMSANNGQPCGLSADSSHGPTSTSATTADLRKRFGGKATNLQEEHDELREENLKLQKNIINLKEEHDKHVKLRNENSKLQNELYHLREEKDKHAQLRTEMLDLNFNFLKLKDKHAALHKESLNLQNGLHYLEDENRKLKDEKTYVTARYDCLVRVLVQPYARDRNLHWDDQDGDSINTTLKPLIKDAMQAKQVRQLFESAKEEAKALEDEVTGLKTQVQSLQKELLARVDKVVAVSDDQFTQDFRALTALVKSLSRSVRITERSNVSGFLEPHLLHENVADHQWANRACKKYYIEAWIWSVLVYRVFYSPFTIFEQFAEQFDTNWDHLFGHDFIGYWPVPSSLCENWRCTSMEQLVDQVGRSTITEGRAGEPTGSEHVQELRNSVIRARNATSKDITSKFTLVSAAADLSRVPAIVDKAFTLALEMSLQRSRLQVAWPCVGDQFVQEEMSCVPDPDGEEFEGGTVASTVHPGLIKWGDANGKNFEERYNIVPALVQVERPVGQTDGVVVKEE
jgi:hypothetical protein